MRPLSPAALDGIALSAVALEPRPAPPQCPLSPAENRLARELACDAAVADFRAGRVAARSALSGATGIETARLEVLRARSGAPRAVWLDEDGRRRPLRASLSLSHRLGHAVAVASTQPVRLGVDLERAGVVPRGLERFFLATGERQLLDVLSGTVLWALKEAAWKALELEKDAAFHALQLVCDDAGRLTGVILDGRLIPAFAAVWEPWPRFIAVVVRLEAEAEQPDPEASS